MWRRTTHHGGHYADTSGGLSSAVTNGPLTALANGGVYAYGSTTTFPSSSYAGSNYWVDVDVHGHLPRAVGFVLDACRGFVEQPGLG